MATFRFNFGAKENELNEKIVSLDECGANQKAEEIKVSLDALLKTDVRFSTQEIVINEETVVKTLNIKHLEETLKASDKNTRSCVLDASLSNKDLVPDLYEGGLKIWECAVDLVEFLEQKEVKFEDKRVLELGCGAGLPGIFGLMKGACVDFQDYNREVIEHFTMPNVFLNLKSSHYHFSNQQLESLLSAKCRFYAGDWKCLENYINHNKDPEQLYDIILTSETIYDTRNQSKLLSFIRSHLRYPYGVVYVAAKTCYFGVGGGTRTFEMLVNGSQDLLVTVSKLYQEGVQREILTMEWRQDNSKE
ncbi:histidine protein methyltransferase 1 homolog [Actinia tenebrosa]|uniref:protein-histidine N-methyltransferase n=1 Tax=Actinia tenebrosa TaxID=6105 RepID=A0A6P8J1Y8_ACTTE|nr:histidine protein methyltransferase 1 homolog [Actinia tenebrosa]